MAGLMALNGESVTARTPPTRGHLAYQVTVRAIACASDAMIINRDMSAVVLLDANTRTTIARIATRINIVQPWNVDFGVNAATCVMLRGIMHPKHKRRCARFVPEISQFDSDRVLQ